MGKVVLTVKAVLNTARGKGNLDARIEVKGKATKSELYLLGLHAIETITNGLKTNTLEVTDANTQRSDKERIRDESTPKS